MSDYAAVWAEGETPHQFYAGLLAIADGLLQLEGRGTGGARFSRTIAIKEMKSIQRVRGAAPYSFLHSWAHLELRSGRSLQVATIAGVGALGELFDLLSLSIANARAAVRMPGQA
jgi:hypothetical protein